MATLLQERRHARDDGIETSEPLLQFDVQLRDVATLRNALVEVMPVWYSADSDRDGRADYNVVVFSKDDVVRALEAYVQFGGPVILHILQGTARKGKTSNKSDEALRAVSSVPLRFANYQSFKSGRCINGILVASSHTTYVASYVVLHEAEYARTEEVEHVHQPIGCFEECCCLHAILGRDICEGLHSLKIRGHW